MKNTKKLFILLAVLTAVCLWIGCADTSVKDDSDNDKDDDGSVIVDDDYLYFYAVDEISAGLFSSSSTKITMNQWFNEVTWPKQNYDQWSQKEEMFLYQDEKLETPFSGSDILNEDTIIYCSFPFNGQGKRIGEITGSITLTNIPHPKTKVYIQTSEYNEQWWLSSSRKINLQGADSTQGAFNWTLQAYEAFNPSSPSIFKLIVIPGDTLKAYEVSVPTRVQLSNTNLNAGNLGTLNIGRTTLSGTINITYNGEPVPFVELYAIDDGGKTIDKITLEEPEENTEWFMSFRSLNANCMIKITAFLFSSSKQLLMEINHKDLIQITNYQSVSDIALDFGDK